MDDNPYQSPESVPEVEKRPRKPPSRFGSAVACGILAAIGPFNLLAPLVNRFTPSDVPLYMKFPMLLSDFLIAGAVGLVMARWAWRHPYSRWVLPVALLLLLTGFIPILIDILFFGFH